MLSKVMKLTNSLQKLSYFSIYNVQQAHNHFDMKPANSDINRYQKLCR